MAADEEVDPGPDQFPGEPPVPLSRSELILLNRAISKGWDVPDIYFRRVLAQTGSMLTSGLISSRTAIRVGELYIKLKNLRMSLDEREADARSKQEEDQRPRIIIPGSDARSRPIDPG
jgi:hypothetical protein